MKGSKHNRAASFIVRRIAPVAFFTAALVVTPAGPAPAGTDVYSGAPISLELVDADFRTSFDDEPAYGELDMELRDFDIVFVYPWPNERALHQDIMRQCGGPHSLLMIFDVREGLSIERLGQRR